jgi:hypothetical protein
LPNQEFGNVTNWAFFSAVEFERNRYTPAPNTMIIAVTTTAIRREREVIKWDSLTADCERRLLQGQRVYLGNVFMFEH